MPSTGYTVNSLRYLGTFSDTQSSAMKVMISAPGPSVSACWYKGYGRNAKGWVAISRERETKRETVEIAGIMPLRISGSKDVVDTELRDNMENFRTQGFRKTILYDGKPYTIHLQPNANLTDTFSDNNRIPSWVTYDVTYSFPDPWDMNKVGTVQFWLRLEYRNPALAPSGGSSATYIAAQRELGKRARVLEHRLEF
ncbi:uncharacterized protein JCM6883_005495 [Sporobolomyces salmoneus]|uniref:uncharacterized protein n=1 Tax=Sporobolomyces salmoneus TaxID=183962 RepID=UPI003178FE6D